MSNVNITWRTSPNIYNLPEYKSHHDQMVFYLSNVDIACRTSPIIYIIYPSTNPTYRNNSFKVRKTRLLAFECNRYCNIGKKLRKYESDKNYWSKSHFFTVGSLVKTFCNLIHLRIKTAKF